MSSSAPSRAVVYALIRARLVGVYGIKIFLAFPRAWTRSFASRRRGCVVMTRLEFSTSFVANRARKHTTDKRQSTTRKRRESRDRRAIFNIIISGNVAKRFGVNVAVDERGVVDADDEEGDAAEEPAATGRALFE